MNQTKADHFKRALIARATELGMDVHHRNTCSPGIKALAQMHAIVLQRPHLLQALEDELLVHDLRMHSSPHAPVRLFSTIRPYSDHVELALIARAIELGMDVHHRNTCSPGIKALAQMHAIVLQRPHLLQAFEDDLLVHDLRLLSSPHAPERFVWTIRPCGTTVFFP